jgi:hypothetical protein
MRVSETRGRSGTEDFGSEQPESPDVLGSVRRLRSSFAPLIPVLDRRAFAEAVAPFSPTRYRLINWHGCE